MYITDDQLAAIPTCKKFRLGQMNHAASKHSYIEFYIRETNTGMRGAQHKCVIQLVLDPLHPWLRQQDAGQIDLTSPPSIRSAEPVIHCAVGETINAISSATSSGVP